MTNVPILHTERLILRGGTLADFPSFAEMWTDPIVTRFVAGKPQTEEESWARFLRNAGHWGLLGKGFWMLELKDTGEMIGQAGYVEGKRAMVPSIRGVPEIGWSLKTSAHGKGYATEAALAALAWGEKKFGRVRNVCIIDVGNEPSMRVAERLGFKAALDTPYHDATVRLFQRDPT